MYRSPIEILMADIQHQIEQQKDEEIYKAVVSVGINVDKEELIRALAYDRHQYMKGHIDGVAEATPRWISVEERLPEESGDYLCVVLWDGGYQGKRIHVVHYYGNKEWLVNRTDVITHWLPLPETPAE